METDPINPSPSDSTPSMEIDSTDPIASVTTAPDPSAEKLSAANPAADETSVPLQAEPQTSESVSTAASTAPDPVIAQKPAFSSISTSSGSEAIAERIQVAATASTDNTSSGGGEWDLLSSKVRQWWDDNNFVELWQRSRRPLFLLAGLIGLTLIMRIYSGILAAIASIPLAPRLFELVGLGWVIWFSTTRLIRSEERKALLANVGGIWAAFKGSVRP
ncbi:MAG: CAAD domain-containing protein [Synechococcus sp. ChSW.bin.154]